MRTSWSSKGIGYYLLIYVFPVVYALTVMPFTVQFFRRFAASPEGDASLFGLYRLSAVHEFFLPLFVVALELISIRLAAAFWATRASERDGAGERRDRGSRLVLVVFLLFQAFPMFSVYFDARITEFRDLQATHARQLTVDPNEQAQADRENQLQATRYQSVLASYNASIATLKGQISDAATAAAAIDSQLRNALQHEQIANTLDERESGKAEVARLGPIATRAADDSRQLVGKLTELNATPPSPPVATVPTAHATPLPFESDVSFLIGTMALPNSYLAAFAALMFGVIVFGAGHQIAAMGGGGQGRGLGAANRTFDLVSDLRFCEALPASRQPEYVKNLEALIEMHFSALRSLRKLSQGGATLQLDNVKQEEELNHLASLRAAVTTSRVEPASKQYLLDVVNRLFAAPMDQAIKGTRAI